MDRASTGDGDELTPLGSDAAAPVVGVGLIGHGFVARAHAQALRTLPFMTRPPLRPRLEVVAGRSPDRAAAAARELGFERSTADWRDLLADDGVGIVDICAPNDLHAEAAVAAARRGRHLVCEKPLGRDAAESYAVWRAAADAGVVHLCGFNYRFVPAVRLARRLIERGDLGRVRHFRAAYLQSGLADPTAPAGWRQRREAAGSGALGDLGAHVIDLARYLVGEVAAVSAAVRTFTPERSGAPVDVDDAFAAVLELDGGALGAVEASRVCVGRKNSLTFEINGEEGSVAFDLERLNELRVASRGGEGPAGDAFATVLVTGPEQPFGEHWWPPGHTLGWEHSFVHELHHFLTAVAGEGRVAPHGATFEDGYRAAEVCDAVLRSAESGVRVPVTYRG